MRLKKLQFSQLIDTQRKHLKESLAETNNLLMLTLSHAIQTMNDDQLQQIIEQTRTSIDRDEAVGKQALACAAEKRTLLSALEVLQAENKRLRQEQQVTNIYNVERDLIQNQIINPLTDERSNK